MYPVGFPKLPGQSGQRLLNAMGASMPKETLIGLEDQLAQAQRELDELRAQRNATDAVLQVINRSTFDLQNVFDTLVESAARLCEADSAHIYRRQSADYRTCGGLWLLRRVPGIYKPHPPCAEPKYIGGTNCTRKTSSPHPGRSRRPGIYLGEAQRLGGFRTMLGVPLLRDGDPVGVIAMTRSIVKPFTDRQVELMRTFADQAVIAIENVRLVDELHESLRQQTATAEVLKVISRSTFDLQTVLDTLVELVTRLCDADHAWLFQREDKIFRWVASFGHRTDVHTRIRDYFKPLQVPMDRGSVTGRTALEARVVHIPDVLSDPEYTWSEAQKIGGYRAALGVPLLRKGDVAGVIFVAKTVPQPFTDKQIDLVTNFADQAVIAIENTRLLNELRQRTDDLRVASATDRDRRRTQGDQPFDLRLADRAADPR